MYQALYRKWRPQVFADVVGQDHITTTLMNEIQTGRHSHAYLFTGSRGTGKTTCAKIFAKAVNCEHPVNGDPCNECETCKGIDNGSILDVIEIDAASNNGVDNIRDIRDEANFTPVNGKYRVYIIDEVHMLSAGAFNALLKTLEEPPEHVKFVLATTEIHKIPATILSRCQRFDFKRITPEDIAGRLNYVASQEGLTLEPDAAMLIARLADGALRDALSILDQCIGHSRNIDLSVVNATVGLAGKDYLFSLGTSILNKDSANALLQINTLHNNSCDMERLCNELTNHFRNLMICKAVKNPRDLIVCANDELEEYQRIASAYSMDFILEILNVLGDTLNNLRKGLNRRVEMEMAIIRLCNSETGSLAKGAQPVEAKPIPVPVPVEKAVETPKVETKPEPIIEQPDSVIEEPAPVADEEEIPLPEEPPMVLENLASFEPETVAVQNPPVDDFEHSDTIESLGSDDQPLKEVIVEPAPESQATMPSEKMSDYVSLQEKLPNGEIPTNIWNAIIRETVAVDKALIGNMNSAKAYRKDDALIISTDNMLLTRFLPQDTHKTAIYNATFTVLGEYLKPRLPLEGEDLNAIEPCNQSVAVEQEQPVEPVEEVIEQPTDQAVEADPLDNFIEQLDGQIDFSLFIEE